MGFIRGGLFVVASVVLFTLFLVGNTCWTIEKSLQYDVIKPELTATVVAIANTEFNVQSLIDNNIKIMKAYCEPHTEYNYTYNGQKISIPCDTAVQGETETSDFLSSQLQESSQNFGLNFSSDYNIIEDYCNKKDSFALEQNGYTLNISCEAVNNGSEAILNEGIGGLVDTVYYQTYNCDFWDCVKEVKDGKPFVLVSKAAHDYWKAKLYWTLSVILIVLAIMFVLIENRTNLPLVAGALLVVASLPFTKLESFFGLFAQSELFQIFTVFFTESYKVFLITFILGLILIAVGIVLKFFKVGFWIENLVSKFKGQKVKTVYVEKEDSNKE